MTTEMARCKPLSALACRAFSLTASSVVLRSFKARGHLYENNGCQFRDSKADKECSLICISGKLDQMDSGVLALKRGDAFFKFIVRG